MEIPRFFLKEFTRDLDSFKQGGEACVFKGTHPLLTGEVAIKQMKKTCDDNEVELLTKNIKHKNIIELLGILIDEQSKCIGYVMPYLDRGSLDDVIHNMDRSYDDIYTSKQVTSWITQICLGLSYLHSKNIIHRDIKPDKFVVIISHFKILSVLLGNSYDDVKLSDFGIARSLENITHHLTKGMGTPIYMAPEMSKTENYNSSVDIYSLSITIWEILHRSVFELFNKISNRERPELRSDLSKEVADLLKNCWDVNVSRRPKIDDILEFSRNTGFQISERETVLLLGGHDGSKCLDSLTVLQNNEKNQRNWKKANIKLPYRVHLHGAQFLKNNLYIFGGQNPEEETLNSTYKLTKRLKWEKMANMKQRRKRISNSNVILNNQIWVLGGWTGKEILKSVEMYDPSINEWKYMRNMNECRADAAAAVVNGKIFCCGGNNGKKLLNSTECYDPSSDVWTFISPMPLPLALLGAVAVDGNLIVMGGWNGKEYLKNVWELNILDKNAEWIAKPSMSRPRGFFSTTKIDGKIFVCGGYSNRWIIGGVEIFDGKVWKQGPSLTIPRYSAACTVIPINFGKYLEYGITRFGRTKVNSNVTYLAGRNETLTVKDINIERETILLLGGDDGKKLLDNLLILQNNEENWKELKIKLPHPIHRHGAQFLDNCLYIFGGQNANDEILNSTYKLSKSFQWQKLANVVKWDKMIDMNEKRCYISNSNVILNDRIWVLGGFNGKENLKSVEMYDPSRNEWKYMKDMNECRSDPAAAVVNGKIFCCGGHNKERLLNSTECYDPSSDVWTFISPMPLPLRGLGAVAMDEKLIVVGGCNSTGESRSVWSLEISNTNAEWIEKSSMSLPRSYFSIAKIDDKIFVCGGDSEEDTIDDVEILDGEVWMNGPKLPTPRSDAASIVIPANFAEYLK